MSRVHRPNDLLITLFRWPHAWIVSVIVVVVRLIDRCRTPRLDFSGFAAPVAAPGDAATGVRVAGRSDVRDGLQARHA
ncbi:hypothetical protein SAVIM338S_07307 [Streptomyces avidinii]